MDSAHHSPFPDPGDAAGRGLRQGGPVLKNGYRWRGGPRPAGREGESRGHCLSPMMRQARISASAVETALLNHLRRRERPFRPRRSPTSAPLSRGHLRCPGGKDPPGRQVKGLERVVVCGGVPPTAACGTAFSTRRDLRITVHIPPRSCAPKCGHGAVVAAPSGAGRRDPLDMNAVSRGP
jgi:hypothetical protein